MIKRKTTMQIRRISLFFTSFLIAIALIFTNASQVLAQTMLMPHLSPLLALTESQITFDFPEPTDAVKGEKLTLWSTFYFAHQAQESNASNTIALRNSQGNSLGVKLTQRDWCQAALEGTVQVVDNEGIRKTYNFAKRGTTAQTNCRSFFSSLSDRVIRAMNRSLFELAKGPFGDGTNGFILVPYRTIAVDKNFISLGTLIYIPDARGKEVILPSGTKVKHDGYFFAADVGGAIRNNKIDTFLGVTNKNPFSHVKSDRNRTFSAFIINDPQIKNKLTSLHKNELPTVIKLDRPVSGESFPTETPVSFSGTADSSVTRIKVTIGPGGPFKIADLQDVKDNWGFTTSFNTEGFNRPVTIQPFDANNQPLKPFNFTITIN